MKKCFLFSALLIAAGLPAHAQQRLGSSGDPTGVGGAYAVYTPEQIQNDDRAGYDTTDTTAEDMLGIHSRRRAQPWVLGGGQAVKSHTEYRKEFEAKQEEARKEVERLRKLRKQQEADLAKQKAAEEKQKKQEEAASEKSAAPAPQNASVEGEDAGDQAVSGIDDDGTLVCVKFQKCDICNRKTPYWSGKECVSGAAVTKMKKASAVQSADTQKKEAKPAKDLKNAAGKKAAVKDDKTAKQTKPASKNAKKSNAKQSAKNNQAAETAVQNAPAASAPSASITGNDVSALKDEYGIRLYNDDGTPKSKKQLYKERQQARIKAFREKNKKSK